MCDIWKKNAGYELSLNEIKQVFGQFKRLDAVRISGGEPFMRNDIHNVINIIDKTVFPKIFHLTTNGLTPDRIVKGVKKIRPLKKLHIKISIDSEGISNDRIRGVTNAYKKSYETVKKLSEIRSERNFYLGVNQTIVNKESMDSYFKLSKVFSEYDVAIHPVFAYTKETALYSSGSKITNAGFKTFGDFSKEELEIFIKKLLNSTSGFTSFKEKIIKRYYLKGVYNRLVKNISKPAPACLALKSHLRILPNGDVPVCLYNDSVAGNLRKQKLEDFWKDPETENLRKWIRNCPGCWAGCETVVSAIYSGDILKGVY